MLKIAIIGSGFIGRAWAISYARSGHDVVIWDLDSEAASKAISYIEGVLGDLKQNDLLNGNTPAQVLSHLSVTDDMEVALKGAIHIQENTPEDVEIKKQVFPQNSRPSKNKKKRRCPEGSVGSQLQIPLFDSL